VHFPVIAWFRLSTRALVVLALVALAVRMFYVDAVLGPGQSVADAWVAYSQLPSFLWFLLAGMVGARLVAERDRRLLVTGPRRPFASWPFFAGLGIMLVVVGASVVDDTRAMFAGPLGLALALAVAGAVVLAAHAPPWEGIPARVAALLGDISYGTYLLHPVVWSALNLLGMRESHAAIATIIAAPPIAFAVHRAFERPAGSAIRSALTSERTPDRPAVSDEALGSPTSSA
jgi:peptidoglycan/LPS O-acetylase OafA/YrhL